MTVSCSYILQPSWTPHLAYSIRAQKPTLPSRFKFLHPSSSSSRKLRRRVDKVLCFWHKDERKKLKLSSSNDSSEFIELHQELEDSGLNTSSTESKNWVLLLKEVKDKFFTLQVECWTVPWTAETIIQVMLLWITSFWFVGSWIIPFLAHIFNFSKHSLTYRGQALYSLVTDIAAGLAVITILHRCLSKFHPLPSGWFHLSLKGTWYFDVFLACFIFPLVNHLTRINMMLVRAVPPPPVVSSVMQSILARDPIAMVLYVLVVSVCAPFWEEILFRGFLLPSLTRYMSLWWSIVVSAVAFAFVHFSVQRLLPLLLLGLVKGVVFAKSRNLLASMLLHSLWNGYVFLDLMK